ncbi:uncharacterized protein At1g01500 [Lactuca sativa]|uniref:Erythronate-4-phosphate dehydrogenase family protein n=1 Tax=Lactuca sativa TaxID=4236 RepID=A0A9R1VQ01_LACSA|nr:uncharacterized protein At1g01500 [Lactuca sativa]XP_023742214.1 uncharacterized protein At1g01500 [Lactuca sativa]KAJ0209354.1 hypothetical protein LSAT_V11C400203510 [Lactuca sativa]
MEKDSYEKSNHPNHGLQIIKHPSYPSYGKRLISWFDIRVFYVRISNFMIDGYTPHYLTLNHIPLNPDTVLEVNGRRCSLQSEGSSCRLKKNRVDKKFEEATFVSTDSIRLSGGVKFEVFDGEDLILFGTLEMLNESKDNDNGKWSMSCESMICCGNGFLKGGDSYSLPPMIEVYVAGSFSGTPIILTKTLQISLKKKQHRKGMLDSIPEYESAESESRKDVVPGLDLQIDGYGNYKGGNENHENYEMSPYWNQMEYLEGEDGALSWFNAGVRVGVGIGLGVCLGVGIGVGLLVRTYQSTARNFRRRL